MKFTNNNLYTILAGMIFFVSFTFITSDIDIISDPTITPRTTTTTTATTTSFITHILNTSTHEPSLYEQCVRNFTVDCLTTTLDQLYDYLSTLGIIDYSYSIIRTLIVIGTGLIMNPHIIGFLAVIMVFYYLFKMFSPILKIVAKMAIFPFRSCVQIVRYRYPVRYNPNKSYRIGAFTQSGGSGGGATAAEAVDPPIMTAEVIRSIEENTPQMVETVISQDIAPAMNPQDMVSCSTTNNTIFSGPLVPIKTWFHRKFPGYEKTRYHLSGPEYDVHAQVDSFKWRTTDVEGTLIYNKNISQLIIAHPRYRFLRSLWTQFRYGIRIIIAPTVNSTSSGVLLGVMSTRPSTTYGTTNFGYDPHGFIQPSSNSHLSFELPEIGVDHWYTAQNDTLSAIGQFTPWNIKMAVLSPLQVPIGGPTELSYSVYAQLINIRARWPQAISATTQGLFSSTTININEMRDSSLPMNMVGDTTSLSFPAFGYDYPSDTRNPEYMSRRVFQKLHNSRGAVNVSKVSMNPNALIPSLFTGENETSISFLFNRPVFVSAFNFRTIDLKDSLIDTFDIGFENFVNADAGNRITNILVNSSLAYEYDEVTVRFYIPKTPYQNGKLLATLTQAITVPTTITAGTYNMSTAPSMIIDLAVPDLVHEWKLPWTTLTEYCLNGELNGTVNFVYPKVAVYVLNPMTATSITPNNILSYVSLSFSGFRLLEPQCLSITTQSRGVDMIDKPNVKEVSKFTQMECRTNAAKLNLESDTVYTHTTDELIDLRQYWRIPHFFTSGRINTSSLSTVISISHDAIFNTFPFLKYYRFMAGSLRYVFTIANWFDVEFFTIECDKMVDMPVNGIDTVLASRFFSVRADAISPNYAGYNNYTNGGGLSGLFPTGIQNRTDGATSFLCYVSREERQIVIDVPIVTPHGFAIQDEPITNYGHSFTITPVPSPANLANLPTVSIQVMAGDDFVAHGISNTVVNIQLDRINNAPRYPLW